MAQEVTLGRNPLDEDEAYDAWRQRQVDEIEEDYPSDAVLLARGKYSTLASEKRELFKELRDLMEHAVGHCTRTLRQVEDIAFMREQYSALQLAVAKMEVIIARLDQLSRALADLKPIAWADGGKHE